MLTDSLVNTGHFLSLGVRLGKVQPSKVTFMVTDVGTIQQTTPHTFPISVPLYLCLILYHSQDIIT